jgi:hypothetical protein
MDDEPSNKGRPLYFGIASSCIATAPSLSNGPNITQPHLTNQSISADVGPSNRMIMIQVGRWGPHSSHRDLVI